MDGCRVVISLMERAMEENLFMEKNLTVSNSIDVTKNSCNVMNSFDVARIGFNRLPGSSVFLQ